MENILIYITAVVAGLVFTKPVERLIKKYQDTKAEYKGYWSE
jgi:hypothetical protein